MPEETTAIDYVMEAASGPHFSGLRLDGLLSAASSPRSSNQTPTAFASSFTPPPDFSGQKQPFVIGTRCNSRFPSIMSNFSKFFIWMFYATATITTRSFVSDFRRLLINH